MTDRDPVPGEIRLHRRRKNLDDWTLRCDSLEDAIQIRDHAADGWPVPDICIQRFTDGEWREVQS